MNYTTRSLTEDEFSLIITTIQSGYIYKGIRHKPNRKVAVALTTEASLGIRISDVLNLHLCDIVRDGSKYRLQIKEIKTGKLRHFVVPLEIYVYLQKYSIENSISESQKLFDITERQVQRVLYDASQFLGYKNVSTHSFRKLFACSVYEKSDHNVALVSALLQHSSIAITSRYLGVSEKSIETALEGQVRLIDRITTPEPPDTG